MHRDDLSKVAPLWLSISEDVREDPEVRHVGQVMDLHFNIGSFKHSMPFFAIPSGMAAQW